MKKVTFTAFAVGLCMTVNVWSQVPSYVPTNGLVGWWPFNGNANDESGNGNNGTVNGATLTTDRFGNANKAYSFDGFIQNNIQIANSNTLNIPNDITISAWFKTNTNNCPTAILGMGGPSGGSSGYNLLATSFCPNKVPSFGRQNLSINTNIAVFDNQSYLNNNWTFVSAVYDGSSQKLYVNGLHVNSVSSSFSLPNLTEPLFFGKEMNTQPRYFTGNIDDIGIWNRALTQQEVTDLYYGCSSNGIGLQPANVSTSNGTNAQFTVNSVLGATYQWQTDLGLGFQNLSNAGQYSGVSSNILTVSNVSNTNNNQQFRCIASNGSCSDTSNVAVLTVSTSGISELDNQNNLKVFPNPSTSHFEIQTNLNYNLAEIRDMQGRLVKTENKNKVINVSSFQKGTYLIRLLDEKSKVIAVQRIIKE